MYLANSINFVKFCTMSYLMLLTMLSNTVKDVDVIYNVQ